MGSIKTDRKKFELVVELVMLYRGIYNNMIFYSCLLCLCMCSSFPQCAPRLGAYTS